VPRCCCCCCCFVPACACSFEDWSLQELIVTDT
jgi:hypothetical protein